MSPAAHDPSSAPGEPPADVVVDGTTGAAVPGDRIGAGGSGPGAPTLPGLRFLPAKVQRLVTTMLPVIDQGVSSASNFVLTIALLRLSNGTGDYVAAVFAYNGLLVVQGCLRTGLYHRLVSQPAGSVDDVVPTALRQVLLGATLAGIVLAVPFGLLGGGATGTIILAALGVLLLQDGLRFASLVYRRDVDALVTDGTWLVAVLVFVAGTFLVVGELGPASVAAAWVAGGAVSVVVLLPQVRYRPRRLAPVAAAVGWRTAVGGVGDFLIPAAITFGLPVVGALTYGETGGAALPACLGFFAICSAFLQGLPAPVLRLLVDTPPARRRRRQLRLIAVIGLAIGAILGAMFLARGFIGELLVDDEIWAEVKDYLLPTAVFVLARFVEIPAYAMGRIAERLDLVVRLRGIGAAVTLVAFVVPWVVGGSLLASFWAFAAASALAATVAATVRWDRTAPLPAST